MTSLVYNKVQTITEERVDKVTQVLMRKKVKKVNKLLHKTKAFKKAVEKAMEQVRINDVSKMIETKDPIDQSVESDIPLDIFPDSKCSVSTVTPPDITTTKQTEQTNNDDEDSSDDISTDTPPPLHERGYNNSDDSSSESDGDNSGPQTIRGEIRTPSHDRRSRGKRRIRRKRRKRRSLERRRRSRVRRKAKVRCTRAPSGGKAISIREMGAMMWKEHNQYRCYQRSPQQFNPESHTSRN